MQQARLLMADGFFFLSESGLALDSKHGAAKFLHGSRKIKQLQNCSSASHPSIKHNFLI